MKTILLEQPTIIWTPAAGMFEEFLKLARTNKLDYIIYIQESIPNTATSCVWACSHTNLPEDLNKLSDLKLFARVQKLKDAINIGVN